MCRFAFIILKSLLKTLCCTEIFAPCACSSCTAATMPRHNYRPVPVLRPHPETPHSCFSAPATGAAIYGFCPGILRHRVRRPIAIPAVAFQGHIGMRLPGAGHNICHALRHHSRRFIPVLLVDKTAARIEISHMLPRLCPRFPVSRELSLPDTPFPAHRAATAHCRACSGNKETAVWLRCHRNTPEYCRR